MHCECGGSYIESADIFTLDDPIVGNITISGIKYYSCDKCKSVLFSIEMSKAIEKAINERKQELINNLPVQDFISAKETSELLGISRQALHKNRRVNNGFIHQTRFGENVVYVRQSVIQYRRTGDGRYPLSANNKKLYQISDTSEFISRNNFSQTLYHKSNFLTFLKISEITTENKEIAQYGNKR